MIFSLNGILQLVLDDVIIIDVGGVGYEVIIPETVRQDLPETDTAIMLYTFHHIREDNQTLFGFLSLEDRRFFTLLTSVSGVGPKVAIKIVSSISLQQFSSAILQENIAILTQISGVGKKMAERMIVELKDKLPKLFHTDIKVPDTSASAASLGSYGTDLTMALKTLGYNTSEIKHALERAASKLDPTDSLENGIKAVLKELV